jgi:hypothetical protein
MPSTNSTQQPLPLLSALDRQRAAQQDRFKQLWRMTAEERVAAMWRGDLTFAECLAWSRRHPQEVPKIGGELAYIVMCAPEYLGED